MPSISIDNHVVTVIDLFSSTPEQQQALIDALINSVETLKQQPGFVSTSVHRSQDGARVATYSQWTTQADYEAFLSGSAGQQISDRLAAFPPPDSHVYEVVVSRSRPAGSIPKISTGGYLTHFAEFRMPSENQPPMLELAKQEVERAIAENTGLVSANFHRSFDGTRVINYGQWLSQAAFEAILRQPGFEPGVGYWVELAENEFYLYDVVFTEPVD